MVNGVEGCEEIEKTPTTYFLRANIINQMIMYISESSFSGMMFAVSMVWIEKVIRVRRDLTTRSMILDKRERLEIGR